MVFQTSLTYKKINWTFKIFFLLASNVRVCMHVTFCNKKLRLADCDEIRHRSVRAVNGEKRRDISLSTMSLKQATDSVNRYCTCNENICNCCRDFHIPVVQLKGPGNYRAMRLLRRQKESAAENDDDSTFLQTLHRPS